MPSGPKPAPTNAAPPFCLTASETLEQFARMGIDTRPRSGKEARKLRMMILEVQEYCLTRPAPAVVDERMVA
jgi:hypothetical protein